MNVIRSDKTNYTLILSQDELDAIYSALVSATITQEINSVGKVLMVTLSLIANDVF